MIRDFYSQSSIYDDCRRPRRVAPAAEVTNNSKKPCPPCLGEALRRGSIVYITIFMVWVRTLYSCLFLQSKFSCISLENGGRESIYCSAHGVGTFSGDVLETVINSVKRT